MDDIMDLFSDGTTSTTDQRNVVLVDVSYFAQRAFHGYFKSGEKVNHVSMRYTLLFTLLIRFQRLRISSLTHRIVMCYDGRNYWQKVFAPYYKCRRKERRKDGKDWEGFSAHMKSLREEFIEYYPFTVLYFEDLMWYDKKSGNVYHSGLEADDVIGILAKRLTSEGKYVTVLTGDGDFTQLDYLDNLSIMGYDSQPIKAEHGCGAFDLLHKIINGDAKDDVANVNSRSNFWETKGEKERQTSAKKLAELACNSDDPMSVLDEQQKVRFLENQLLKDFNYIPSDLVNAVNFYYDNSEVNPISRIRDLFHDLDVNDEIIQDNLVDLIEKVL